MSVAEGPPELPYPKLPFWDAVGLSYSTFFGNFIDALRASWLWLIVTAALTAVASWQQWSRMATAMATMTPGRPPQVPKSIEMAVLLDADNALMIFAGVSIAVAWHRLLILNEHPGLSGRNITTGNLWRYVVIGVALFLIMFLPVAVTMIPTLYFMIPAQPGSGPPSPSFVPLILLGFVLYAAGIAIALRLSPLLPARAIGNTGLTFRQTWNRTRGNTWRLFWGIVVTTVPLLILAQIAFLIVIGAPLPGAVRDGDFVAKMTAANTVFVAYYLLILPISIGFLSHAYRHFFQAPLELPD